MTLSSEVDNLVFEEGQLTNNINDIYFKLVFYANLIESKLSVYNGLETDNERMIKDYSELRALKDLFNSFMSDLDHIKTRKDELLNSVIAIVKYHDDLDKEDIERISNL